ncbi:MAG: RagB/SusD family nutrient uptake outer membrane protein [Bacteroidales bacterium]|nr:RagB/SusD family nutrient uptake outer membrane protein [Bacteroidales bacterium]
MKKTLYLLLLSGILGACSLDETPYGFYSGDNFYKSEEDAESGLMYAYNSLNYLEYCRAIWYVGDIPTDCMYPKSDESGDIHMLENWTVTSNTELTHYYFKYCYIGINRANAVIKKISEGNFTPEVKDRVVGEALFLRAWNYFNLVRTFGRCPLTTGPISSLEQTTAPLADNLMSIYDLIIDDCLRATRMLKVNKVFGRVDKVGAEALLSKVYLHLASSKHYQAPGYKDLPIDADDMYAKAAGYARKVVNDYPADYGMDDNLRHLYDVAAPDGPEHIFIMATDRSGTHEGMYTKIPLQFLPNNSSIPIFIKYPDGSLQMGNGNGWGVFLINDDFVEGAYLSTDKRRTELLHRTIYDQNGNEVLPSPVRGYFTSKYVDPDFIGERTSARPFLLRWSDIALVLAEAAGPDEGYPLVNRIRSRAGIADLTPGLSLEDFRRAVINERKLELAFEGNRLFDLRRTASVTTTVQEASRLSEEEAAFYPIPQREVDLNPNVPSSQNN